MSAKQSDELGPIDYLVVQWKADQPVTGEGMTALLDLVDRGLVRILDLGFLKKDADGSVSALDFAELTDPSFAAFEGSASGVLSQEDLEEAAAALDPNTVAAVLIWENRWAVPMARALRRSGASSSPTAGSPPKICSPRWPRASPTTHKQGAQPCQDYSRRRPHRGHRRNHHPRQQQRVAPAGEPLG